MTDNYLIFIPNEGNYIEILGHRIDGFDSFESFCEHLNKYAVMEKTITCQNAEIERLQAIIDGGVETCDNCHSKYAKKIETVKAKAIEEEVKKFNELIYIIRNNMTSITRYVRYDRKDHPTLTDGQSLDRHMKYKELADVAVTKILEYINGEPCKRNGG